MTAPVVVILAAGQGTRMRSDVQKLLHPLCGRPIIEWPIAAAREAGAGKVVVVDSPARPLEPAAGDEVVLAVQERPLGTADAVRAAMGEVEDSDTVIVVTGDAPLIRPESLKALLDAHRESGAAATIATMVLDDPSGYGRVVRAPDGTVERVVETKNPGDATELELHIREVNTGMFAFEAAALIAALKEVRADNAQGEHYLPDVLPVLRRHERTVAAFELSDPNELLGINDRRQLAEVTAIAQRQIHERLMLAGVTIVNPEATVIDHGVSIGRDTVIAPFTSLHGTTSIGERSAIGPGTTIIDTQVGDESKVLHSYLTGAVVGDRVSVGPFAYLRPGTILREGSKAGTFVEIKNSDVGRGSKVPHLSYIGDAEIGEGTNLGASTITANYDGYRKNRTVIGHRVKTAVHTTLVAPVTVGDDAYTGAGSAITTEVPPGSLAVARSRQTNIAGYAERRRERAEAEKRDAARAAASGENSGSSAHSSHDESPAKSGESR
ncbi:MAG TPA: bifunctional UDP-N-acetylglucosamine diphosphorylase/glucosamine-1-phosphate N-acetyltransferase GlmU [Solirubrobacteraceae bacterium]|nr:bifunctional UDP-N-acetylglucosamine diphosphorylase/glucosamine-1-phosphate N-acetyltransferase GlmU [Solirubrobacteraceae bacterium]